MRKLITTDSHLVPPPWLLDELPERLRSKVVGPRYEVRDGQAYLTFAPSAAAGLKRIGLTPEIKIESDQQLVKAVHFAYEVDANPYFDPQRRLVDLARENVVAAVLIHNPAFPLQRTPERVEAQIAYCTVVNDWLADTYKDHLHCFAPGIHLPYLDAAACAVELERAAGFGLRPGLLPDAIGDAPYWDPQWEAVWEVAAGLGVPLTMHIGGTRNVPPPAPLTPRKESAQTMGSGDRLGNVYGGETFEGFYGGSCDMGRTLIWLTFSGVFQRHPDLTVVMTEGYAFWLAGLMQFCDHHWEGRFKSVADVKVELEAPPSHYMKRQAKATFMWDPVAINNREVTGSDCLLWANDYPHPEGVFPFSQEAVSKQFAGVPEADIEKMTFTNAATVFGFDV